MSNTATGIVLSVGQTQQVSDKFRKRDLIIKTEHESQYPQECKFQLTQDKCELADKLEIGHLITVHYNLRGRAWVKDGVIKDYFNTLEIWRIEYGVPAKQTESPQPTHTETIFTGSGDLPF
jgi:hypothetical protein